MSLAILDLQGMEEQPISRRAVMKSSASHDCGNIIGGGGGGPHFSGLSLLLCG